MPAEANGNIAGNRRQLFIQRTLDALLEALEPGLRKTISLMAVPHWFDEELLRRLSGDSEGWAEVLGTLLEFQLARQDSQNRLHYQDDVRKILRDSQRTSAPQEYLETNRNSHDYFLERTAEAPAMERLWLEREALYHRLIFDEPAGLHLLNEELQKAFSLYQLDAAEMLVDQVEELRDELSKSGQQWLDYFMACLQLATRKYDPAGELLHQLEENNLDASLRALVDWKKGQLLIVQHRWSQAIRYYKHSLELLGAKAEPTYRARVLLALGEAYRDLASHSGGYAPISIERPGWLRSFLLFFQHFPFLCIEWVVRRISFLPNLYFGTDYQDWIIDRLLFVAEGWMVKAERLLASTDQPVELSEARLALAGVEHHVGHWSRARHRYAKLEEARVIEGSPYRFAKVRLGQGEASLTEGKPAEALEKLSQAVEVFRVFRDPASNGTATFLLGQAFARLGKLDQAAQAFLDSAGAFETVEDDLALTRVLWSLETLFRQGTLPERLQARVEEFLERLPRRHTITRFPDQILKLYRILALLVALPLAYLLVYRVGSDAAVLLSFLETLYLSPSNALEYPILLFLTLLAKLALPLLLAFWIYRGIYGILGLIAVYVLGRQLVLIEQEPPVHFVIDANGITSYTPRTDESGPEAQEPANPAIPEDARKFAWSDIGAAVAIHYRIISQPIELISRLVLQPDPAVPAVEGSTIGYRFLLRNIKTLLARQPQPHELRTSSFTFLEWRSVLVASMLVLAFISYLFHIGQIEVSGGFSPDVMTLPISTIIEFTVRTLLLVLPAVILWRVWIYRLRLENELGEKGTIISRGVILVAALLSSAIAVRWILYLALTQ